MLRYKKLLTVRDTMPIGYVIQNLARTDLELAMPKAGIWHRDFAVADAPGNHKSTFIKRNRLDKPPQGFR